MATRLVELKAKLAGPDLFSRAGAWDAAMTELLGSTATQFVSRAGSFVPVAIDTLIPSSIPPFDLYMKRGVRGQYVLFCERSVPLTLESLLRITESGVLSLYVTYEDREEYCRYLQDSLLKNDDLTLAQRYSLTMATTKSVFDTAYTQNDLGAVVEVVHQVADQISRCLLGQSVVMRQLFDLMFHDYSTFTHANNVSIYSVALARATGIGSLSDLTAIASGALLHDIGKRHISPLILNQKGCLTDKQKRIVRRHPQLGYEDFCHEEGLCWGQLMMIYQHHERLDGSGYPVRIDGDEIHPWAKLCAVADVFDALTSARPFRKALSVEDAIRHLRGREGSGFESEIVECLVSLMMSTT